MARVPSIGLAALLGLSLFALQPANASDKLVRFDGGIGSQPLRAGGLVNDVFGVPPGGRPWVIERLSADISTDGRIRVDGRGLLLGGGNNIGLTGGQSVRARLFCNSGATFHDSDLVPLEPNGDFRINGMLTTVPPPVCANAVLLILNAGGSWFAAGIPKL